MAHTIWVDEEPHIPTTKYLPITHPLMHRMKYFRPFASFAGQHRLHQSVHFVVVVGRCPRHPISASTVRNAHHEQHRDMPHSTFFFANFDDFISILFRELCVARWVGEGEMIGRMGRRDAV